jgi:uncharacterized protein (UPF0332 family)
MTAQRDAEDYLAKAQESLASAEADLAGVRYNSCMNRCYYACFQAAVAALIRHGSISAHAEHEHYFVQSAFVVLIRRRRLYSSALSNTLPTLMAKRHVADYRITMTSRSEARHAVTRASDFVTAVASRNQ